MVDDPGMHSGFASAPPSGRSPFPPIADYAFLSDCEVNCLIAPSGAVEWMCLPRPDSPSVFSAMLDRGAGAFRIGPYDEMVPAARRYLPGSLMLETTWQTRTGWLHRARRAVHGAVAQRRRAVADAPPLADRLRRRALPAADRAVRQRLGRPVDDLRAGRSTTAGASRSGATTGAGYGEVVATAAGHRRRRCG